MLPALIKLVKAATTRAKRMRENAQLLFCLSVAFSFACIGIGYNINIEIAIAARALNVCACRNA